MTPFSPTVQHSMNGIQKTEHIAIVPYTNSCLSLTPRLNETELKIMFIGQPQNKGG